MERLDTDPVLADILERIDRNAKVPTPDVPDSAEIVAKTNRAVAVQRARALSVIGEAYARADVDNLPAQRETRAGILAAKAVVDSGFAQSLALWGKPPGVGKTWLAAGIVNAAIESGKPAALINALDLVTIIRDTRRTWGVSETETIARFADLPVLAIDDLGKDVIAGESALSVMYQLINRRSQRGLPLILTSNYSFPDLFARYSQRRDGSENDDAPYIMDRISGLVPVTHWVEMGGRSLRNRAHD